MTTFPPQGMLCFLGKKNLISWLVRKQQLISWSSTEAEYRAMANTTFELWWILNLFQKLHVPLQTVLTLYCRNIDTTYLCSNLVFYSKMKHVSVDFYFVHDQVVAGLLHVSHVSGKDESWLITSPSIFLDNVTIICRPSLVILNA